MFLQGTIYSDGKSSTILSPHNLADVTNYSRSKKDQTELLSIPASPNDSEESSLLISEET